MRYAIALLLIVTTVFVFTPTAEADTATYHQYRTMLRRDKRKVQFDGYSCSCTIYCSLGQGSWPIGAWGFARDYDDAVGKAEKAARSKCTSKSKRVKGKLVDYTIRGKVVTDATCDPLKECSVHYTPLD